MKKFIIFGFFFILLLYGNVNRSSAQPQWNKLKDQFVFKADPTLSVSNATYTGATFSNNLTESRENIQNNRFSYRSIKCPIYATISSRAINISFKAKHFASYRQSTYIGYTIHYGTSSGSESMTKWYCCSADRYGNCSYSQKNALSSNWQAAYLPWDREVFNNDILVEQDGRFSSHFLFDHFRYAQIAPIQCIYSIEIHLSPGAMVTISDFKVEQESIYRQANFYIYAGDEKMKSQSYIDASVEYTKAIDCGYKNYDIYYKRAIAYAAANFFNNAIEDCTKALSYKTAQEAYLLRGKLKLQKADSTCLEDLMKGGSEGEAIAREIATELAKQQQATETNASQSEYTSSGSGIVLTANGIIITNHHVIDNAQKIDVFIEQNGQVKKYKAKVLISDKQNDLTLLKIDDTTFTNLPALPYAVKSTILDVGTSVFALGYPMSNTLGEELKVTDGIISSKTGYQGDIVTYQISAPIQPGNSGGPLFDKQGYLVGITNAGVPDAQNVGYAIKASYLRNLVDVSPVPFTLPSNNTISGLSFTEKIKKISPYVVLIKVK